MKNIISEIKNGYATHQICLATCKPSFDTMHFNVQHLAQLCHSHKFWLDTITTVCHAHPTEPYWSNHVPTLVPHDPNNFLCWTLLSLGNVWKCTRLPKVAEYELLHCIISILARFMTEASTSVGFLPTYIFHYHVNSIGFISKSSWYMTV